MPSLKRWFRARPDLWVCVPPKCGGTALYSAVFNLDPALGNTIFYHAQKLAEFVTPDEIEPPAIMAVRHPATRFLSLWRNKCRDGDPNFPDLQGMSIQELLDMIAKDVNANPHWTPQKAFWRPGVTLVEYRKLFDAIGLKARRLNETSALLTDPELSQQQRDTLQELYAEDYELWNRVA